MKKLRVLLVDDEIMIREGFKRLFDWEAHDCEVVGEAADGMEALAQIDALLPDIAIMDINIPIMNGLKVIQLSRMKHPDIAFVIVSGYDDFAYCREALRLQITDYILKPVNYEEFGSCIDNLKISLFRRRTEEEPAAAEEERPIAAMTRYMQAHLAEEVSLNLLAEEFHLSPQYISQLLKSESGVNFLTVFYQHPHGAGEKAAADHIPAHRGGVGAVRLRRLPGVHKGVQKVRGRHALPVPPGFSGTERIKTAPSDLMGGRKTVNGAYR